ncbi:ABC transporter permease [Mageeibacillus indolicus]|uniref:ABC transporter permease n=1 Tax=Mageeibacillus indolicus TaxID=884684 RepID=UPI000C9C345A|nr:ABC transporter permease subunit [Mageeibacillus indolicus]
MNNNKAVNSNPAGRKGLSSHPSSLPSAAGSAALAAAEALPLAKNKYKEFVKKFIRRKTAVVALIFILFLLIVAALGPEIAPYDANQPDYNNLLSPPSAEHIWGTDEFGRDIFSRLLAGTRLSLLSALSATIVGASIGIILGLLAGYYGGWINALVMRGSDVLFAFPDILLAIAIVAIIGPGMVNVVIAVAVFTIPSFARIVRSATLTVKEAPYVEVARSIGCKDRRILWIHVFPGTVQSMIVNFTMRVGTAILAASSLSFLGFGANVTEPDWGAMLSQGRNYLNTAPYIVLFPGMLIFLTVLAFNLLGDGLRDTLDPKLN